MTTSEGIVDETFDLSQALGLILPFKQVFILTIFLVADARSYMNIAESLCPWGHPLVRSFFHPLAFRLQAFFYLFFIFFFCATLPCVRGYSSISGLLDNPLYV